MIINRFDEAVKCYLWFVLSLYAITTCNAQGMGADTLSISCLVVDASENAPIAFANVQVFDTLGVRIAISETDQDGKCSLLILRGKACSVSVSYLGYEPFSKNMVVANNDPLILKMNALVTELQGVTIKADRPVFKQEPGKLVMYIGNTSLVQGSNMLEVLQKAPGIITGIDGALSYRGKQGIQLLINNKSTYVTGEELSRYLETLPASDIEKIEIISNPSARFDAAGNVGVINIVTKKSKEKQLNGSAQASGTYGNYFRSNASLQLNAQPKPALSVHGSLNYSDGNTLTVNNSERSIGADGQDVYTLFQEGDRVSDRLDNRAKVGVDYIKGKHTLSFLANGFWAQTNSTNKSLTDIGASYIDSTVLFNSLSDSDWGNISTNLNYILAIDSTGRLLDVNADFASFDYEGLSNMRSDFTFTGGGTPRSEIFRNISPSQVAIAAIKADYTHPLKPGSYFQGGFKYSAADTDNELIFELFNDSALWENDPQRSNHFLFKERISAAYIDYYNRFGQSWDYGVGVRAEHSISKGNNLTIDSFVKRNIFALFPSGYIRKTYGNQSLMLTYSKRIDRPDYNSLNPFVFYVDNYSFWQGNTSLRPQFAHVFDLAHSLNQKWFTNLYYTYTDDAFMQLPIQDDATGRVFNTVQNIGVSHYIGVSLSHYASLKQWWYIAATLSGSYSTVVDKRSGGGNGVKGTQGYGYIYNAFTLPRNFRLDATLVLTAPSKSFWYTKGTAVLSLGCSKSMGKSTISFSFNDIFNGTRYIARIGYQNLNIESFYKPESRFVRLNYAYRFGNNKVRQQRERKTGADEEIKRVKN